MRRRPLFLLISGMVFLFVAAVLEGIHNEQHNSENALHEFQAFLSQRAGALDRNFKKFGRDSCPVFSETKAFKQSESDGLYWFAYTAEDILFWSGNSVPVTSEMIRNKPTQEVWKLKNGWYIAKRYSGKSCTLLGLALIRNEYSYQNEYLVDAWFGHHEFPFKLLPSESSAENRMTWKEPNSLNQIQFIQDEGNLDYTDHAYTSTWELWPLWLSIAGLLLCFAAGHWQFAFPSARSALFWWAFLLACRIAAFIWHTPSIVFKLPLFSPSDYAASDWLPTLGDLLLHTALVLYGSFLLFLHTKSSNAVRNKTLATSAVILVFAWTVGICHIIRGLILHSSISLDFSDIFNINSSSFIAYLIIIMLFGTVYLLAGFVFHLVRKAKLPQASPYFLLAISYVCGAVLAQFRSFPDQDVLLITGGILLILYFLSGHSDAFRYTHIIGLLTIFALAGNYFILHDTSVRELEKRKLLVAKISAERDPIAESLFRENEDKILNDTLLKSYLRPTTVIPTGQVRDLAQLYFNGYWEKYNIVVNVFGTDECPLTSLYTTPVSDPLVFDRLIDSIGIPTQSGHFFYMDKGSGRISYLARLQIHDTNRTDILGMIYIDFQSRYTPEEIGYPELLLDQMVTSNTDLSNYSYARYKEGSLVSHYGNFPYPLRQNSMPVKSDSPFNSRQSAGFEHLEYQASDHSLVVLSLPKRNFMAYLTPFSYLMLISGLLILLVLVARELRTHKRLVFSFKRRIQYSIVGLLLLTLFMVSAGTLLFLSRNNLRKNQHDLSEKIHSVLVETEYNLYSEEGLNPFKADDLGYLLTRQANIFFADINLFDPSGQLFASSRPKIFEEGLVSKKMHPEAFYEMKYRYSSEFIHQEQTGLLQYLSAYVPVRNRDNKVIAYLNLPYFARQSELKREISVFLVTIINIYVLLIVLVVIAAIFLSNRITEPLRLIQERLSRIRLGSQNEMIAWKGNDEIASLISEYNRMVEELSLSAGKLARSERESAWREMAKQVAHEIKNPLTPIKLSIQHLSKAWNDKAPDFEERLDRFSKTLIEQIDTLSHIATEFSNFAQMPKMVFEPVDLNEMLKNIVDFFAHSEGIELEYIAPAEEKCLVMSDREQLLRAFNNLVRNAIQSIPEERKGKITVQLRNEDSAWLVSVQDNGSGIPEHIQEKIFYPNFTTRTGGMGLGLALVKSIIESSEGSVWFSTVISEGSIFYVQLPASNAALQKKQYP